MSPAAAIAGCAFVLLPVVRQHLSARCAQFGAVLLKAGQNDEIALIHDLAAEALNVAGAGLLLLRRAAALLGESGGNQYRREGKCQDEFMHHVLSFRRQRSLAPNSSSGMAGTDNSDERRRGPRQPRKPETLVNAAKFATLPPRNVSPLRRKLDESSNWLIYNSYLLDHGFFEFSCCWQRG
jgi:hypothetical protein